ncbi:MAG: hypothetical protein LBN97_08980 [Oscillospiraceae bacterium]|jgi:hypothetical protein|nr:hypothetical protein [Oscillospiraceae bacterium]
MLLSEFRLALKRSELYWVVSVGLIVAVIGLVTTRNLNFHSDFQHLPNAYQAALIYGQNMLRILYILLVPIIAALSYADSYFVENRDGVFLFVMTRRKFKLPYFLNKAIVIFVISFVLTVLPLVVNQLLCLYVFSPETTINGQMNTPYDLGFFNEEEFSMIYPVSAESFPIRTSFTYIALTGLYGSALALAAFSVTLFYRKNRASVLIAPLLAALVWELVSSFTSPAVSPVTVLSVKTFGTVSSIVPMAAVIGALIVLSLSAIIVRGLSSEDDTGVTT